jgi:hypothetical protein
MIAQEIHHVFGTAIQFRVPFLAAEPFHLGDRQTGHADLRQAFAHFVKLERLYDCSHLFHNDPLE